MPLSPGRSICKSSLYCIPCRQSGLRWSWNKIMCSLVSFIGASRHNRQLFPHSPANRLLAVASYSLYCTVLFSIYRDFFSDGPRCCYFLNNISPSQNVVEFSLLKPYFKDSYHIHIYTLTRTVLTQQRVGSEEMSFVPLRQYQTPFII